MRSAHSITGAVLLCGGAIAGEERLVAHWTFDEKEANTAMESVNRVKDTVEGNFRHVEGVRGSALKLDGFTTRITREHHAAPDLSEGAFTIAAWVAPHAYPWNWCAIVEHGKGYFFGIDPTGHVGLHMAIDNQWRECTSEGTIPFMAWSHIAATFDPERGIALYIDGERVGELHMKGYLTVPGDQVFQIGRNVERIPPAALVRPDADYPSSFSFDGIIDELKIHDLGLTAQQIAHSYEASKPDGPPPLSWRKLPEVPEGPNRFGAYYTKLRFYDEWDALWRVDEHPDVVIKFDDGDYKMIFWRGTNYNMNLVTENNRWIADQSAETGGMEGLAEHMSDKHNRYSHVRVIENHNARVVVHWRYALTDLFYTISSPDPMTGWGDWVDEYYYIYPDGVAVRHFAIHGVLPAPTAGTPGPVLARSEQISMIHC